MTMAFIFFATAIVFLWYTSTLQSVNGNFNCITREGLPSIECAAPFSTMVSCGCKTNDPMDDTDGCYLNGNNFCTVENADTANGNIAVARCCDFNHIPDLSCVALQTPFAVNDDGLRVMACHEGGFQYLTGCSASSYDATIDGSYPGTTNPQQRSPGSYVSDQYCTVQNGQQIGSGSQAHLVCCNSPTNALDCVFQYGAIGAQSTATCPTQLYQMTGCSGYGLYNSLNAWYIQNDQCIARSNDGSPGVYAIAICCMLVTNPPTADPILPPSSFPTSIPSIYPTDIPTTAPSEHPTMRPSTSPTKTPTEQPTSHPTLFPSYVPTSTPTSNPTSTPTANPSSNPTSNPTSVPTVSPISVGTSDPTSIPTENPIFVATLNPTSNPIYAPTSSPTSTPASNPISAPTSNPTSVPTIFPSSNPTSNPTSVPTIFPSSNPISTQTSAPTSNPISAASSNPTSSPT
eukprot:262826_1